MEASFALVNPPLNLRYGLPYRTIHSVRIATFTTLNRQFAHRSTKNSSSYHRRDR